MFEPLESRRLLSVNVTTYHYSNAETGANTNEAVLTQANVNTTTFGKVASFPVDGQVFAQPLVMTGVAMANGQGTHDIVLVATEADDVYAFDANGNNPAQGYYWHVSLLQAGESTMTEAQAATTDITPQLGVTGTPVIDPTTNTLYVVGVFYNGSTYSQRLYALNVTSGFNASSPVTISASVSGSTYSSSPYYNNSGGIVSFDAHMENQRPALTLANGEIYIGWASHGDNNPWHGWVMSYNKTTLAQDHVYCDTLNGNAGGIWMSGGGIAVDSSGNLYFTTGNGSFNASASSNVSTPGLNFAMSLEKLSPSLTPIDYFAPYNQASLSGADLDFGCSNVILLTNQAGSYPNQVISAGKWGTIYLNSSDTGSLGEFHTTTNIDLGQANITSNLSTSNVHQTIVSWNGYVYLAGDGLPLEAFSLANFASGTITPISSQSGHDFGVTSIEDAQGGGLTVSSNGTANGILWALDNSAYNTTSASSYTATGPAVLYAYNANNLAQPLWSSASASGGRDTAGPAIKFQDPVVANGHVYIAGLNSVTIYGLLSSSSNAPTITTAAAASPTVTTSTTNLSVSATDVSGDTSPQYYWAASSAPVGPTSAIPTFSVNNTSSASATTATFYEAGAYTLTCTVEDPTTGYTTTSSVNVTVTQTLSGMTVSPSSAVVNNNGTVQFTASAVDQFGYAMTSQPTFTWSVTSGNAGGSVNASTGLYSAPVTGTGTDTITATSGSSSASATATVAVPSSTFQSTLTFNHFGIATNGRSIPNGGIDGSGSGLSNTLLGTAADWSSGTVKNWNGSSFVTGTATNGNNTNNVLDANGQTITFGAGHYTAIKLLALHINGSASDNFTFNYTDGTTQTATQSFSDWYTQQSFTGEYQALVMPYRIQSNGSTDNRTFYLDGYVLSPNYSKTLQSITLPVDTSLMIIAMDESGTLVPTVTTAAAASPTTITGTTTALSVGGTDPTGDASPTFTWVATNMPGGAVAPTFSSNGTTSSNLSTATFHTAGNYTFTVYITDPTTAFNVSSTVSVTVTQTMTSILESPPTVKLYDGGSTQLAATAYDQFGNAMASQPSFTWSVKPGGVGGTANASTGFYSAPSTGSGIDILNASSGAISGGATITVLNPYPVLSAGAAASPSPVTGTTAQVTALATDSAGDVKPTYTWAVTNMPSGAATPVFSPNGNFASNVSTATFYQAGAYTFTVTITDMTSGGSISSSVNVTVNQTLTSINVTPTGPLTLYNGQTQQFSAVAVDQFGQNFTSPPPFTWSDSGIGSISSSGLYQAPAGGTGSAAIQASAAGVNGSSGVVVAVPAWLGAGNAATWNSSTMILNVTGATSIVADPGSDQPIIQANGSAAVTFNPGSALQIHIGGLSLTNGASAVVTSLGGARTSTNHRVLVLGLPGASTAPLLTIDSASTLNLTDNDLVDHDGSLTGVQGLLTTGYNSATGYWNGAGIDSTVAAIAKLTTLGSGQPAAPGTFDNETVGTSDVEVRYTYYGDATLDGHVDGGDYSRIDYGYTHKLTGFSNGDFNYDNAVNGSDYTLIDNAFNVQGASFDAQIALPAAQVAPATMAIAKSKTPALAASNTGANSSGLPALQSRSIGVPPFSTKPLVASHPATGAVNSAAMLVRPNAIRSTRSRQAFNGTPDFSDVTILLDEYNPRQA